MPLFFLNHSSVNKPSLSYIDDCQSSGWPLLLLHSRCAHNCSHNPLNPPLTLANFSFFYFWHSCNSLCHFLLLLSSGCVTFCCQMFMSSEVISLRQQGQICSCLGCDGKECRQKLFLCHHLIIAPVFPIRYTLRNTFRLCARQLAIQKRFRMNKSALI